jgi:hypothetical protein
MGIRIKAKHLACPACGASITPQNTLKSDHETVRHLLAKAHPDWDPEGAACEACVSEAYRNLPDRSFIDRLKDRFSTPGQNGPLHLYRTKETA